MAMSETVKEAKQLQYNLKLSGAASEKLCCIRMHTGPDRLITSANSEE